MNPPWLGCAPPRCLRQRWCWVLPLAHSSPVSSAGAPQGPMCSVNTHQSQEQQLPNGSGKGAVPSAVVAAGGAPCVCLYKVVAWRHWGHETTLRLNNNATALPCPTNRIASQFNSGARRRCISTSSALPSQQGSCQLPAGWWVGPWAVQAGGWVGPSAQATGWGVRGARALASMNCWATSTCSSSAGQ